MDYFESIILGVVQGLTEFLPISSSGHLEISKAILGNDFSNKESLLFTIVLHFATALSTIVFFRKDISQIILGLFDKNDKLFKYKRNLAGKSKAEYFRISEKIYKLFCCPSTVY